jgi:hypothetical protein
MRQLHYLVIALMLTVHMVGNCDDPREPPESKLDPDPIEGTVGQPEDDYYFDYWSDVDDPQEAGGLIRFQNAVKNNTKTKLLTADWPLADVYFERLAPGRWFKNPIPAVGGFRPSRGEIRYGDSLGNTKTVGVFVEANPPTKGEQSEPKRGVFSEFLESKIIAELGENETIEFTFSSSVTENSIKYNARIETTSDAKDVYWLAFPQLAKQRIRFDAAEAWNVKQEDAILRELYDANGPVTTLIRSVATVRISTTKVVIYDSRVKRPLLSGRVAMHALLAE